MASANVCTVQSVLSKICKGHLECSICSNHFKEPKMLDCKHTFCLECLGQLSQGQDPRSTKLSCPLCRCETALVENRIADLPDNFTLSALVEEVAAMQEQLLQGQGSLASDSAAAAQLLLAKISRGHLECSICSERFKEPRMLDCLHTFCLKCLQELKQTEDLWSAKLTCPLCRGKCMLKENQVACLPKNFPLSGLVEEVARLEQLLEDQVSEIKGQNEMLGSETVMAKFEQVPGERGYANVTFAFGVAVFSNNEAVVVDIKNNQLLVFPISNWQYPATLQELEVPDLSRPRRVSVNRHDQLIVVDGVEVKVFDRAYQLIHQFTPEQPPSCLAVDDNNVIAVGNAYTHTLFLYEPDGSLIRTMPAQSISEHLAIWRRRFIYTNWRGKKLLSADKDGDKEFLDDISDIVGQYWGPAGVCCDRNGNIFVAENESWKETKSGKIHQFSPEGKYIGCVIQECGSPRGIALTPDGNNLVVAAVESIKIFKRL